LNPVLLFVGAVVCCDTLSTTPIRHYAAFILGLMPSLCDWASSLGPAIHATFNATTVIAGKTVVAPVLVLVNATSVSLNGQILATASSMQGVERMKGGAMLVSVVLTASLVCMIDRLYLQMAMWTSAASLLSLCGLMHAEKMGWYTAAGDSGWRFAAGYGLVACSALVLHALQSLEWGVEPPVIDEPEEIEAVKVAYRSSLYDPRHQKQRTSFVAQTRSRAASASQLGLPTTDMRSGMKAGLSGGISIHPKWPADNADGRLTL